LSLKTNSKDSYLIASNYRNLGICIRNAAYPAAAKYYTHISRLDNKSREHNKIKKLETISMK
jgi:hypothetical protein